MFNFDFDQYLRMLDPSVSNQVQSIYFPNPENDANRGVPQYTGQNYNAYSNINPNKYRGMDKRDNPGDKLYADLIRAQTRDYNARFAPVENFMANEITATGTRSLAGDLSRTRGSVMDQGANVQGMTNRANERFGLAGNSSVGSGQGQVSALVGGLNDTKLRDQDRRTSLLTGSLSGISQKARGVGK